MALPSYLKVQDESVYYTGDGQFVLIVPDSYFDKNIAVIEGVYIELIGILNQSVLSPKETDITKHLKPFYFPSRFITRPGRTEKVKNFQLTPDYKGDFTILYYTNNNEDQIIVSTKVPQDITNVEDFFRVFVTAGDIPTSISYKDLWRPFIDSMTINGNSYGLPAADFGLLISELCRDPQNINKPFRLGKSIDSDPYSYIPISVKYIPKLVSPFTSLTSENFDQAMVGAIMNQNDSSTPLERVLTG